MDVLRTTMLNSTGFDRLCPHRKRIVQHYASQNIALPAPVFSGQYLSFMTAKPFHQQQPTVVIRHIVSRTDTPSVRHLRHEPPVSFERFLVRRYDLWALD